MRYNIPIPLSRGTKYDEYKPQLIQDNNNDDVNGLIIHSLISRISYSDNSVEEYRPVLNENRLEFDIDQNKLDDLTSRITFGPKINQWKWWLFGYDQLLNTYDDVIFNSIIPYSDDSYLGTSDRQWESIYLRNIEVSNNANISGILNVYNNTQSQNITTGAMIVNGGIGIGKNLNVGEDFGLTGILRSFNNTESVNFTTGSAVYQGGVGIGKNLNICGNVGVVGVLSSNNTADSTSNTTGAIVTLGGLGIRKTVHIGEQLFVDHLEYNNNLSLRPINYNPSTGNISYSSGATMVLSASANYAISNNIANHAVLLCNLSTQDIIIDMSNLPDGYVINVKKLDKTVHLVKFNVTIDGDTMPSIKSQYESLAILKTSGSYYII